jgi:hypothetical protein
LVLCAEFSEAAHAARFIYDGFFSSSQPASNPSGLIAVGASFADDESALLGGRLQD